MFHQYGWGYVVDSLNICIRIFTSDCSEGSIQLELDHLPSFHQHLSVYRIQASSLFKSMSSI
jgi:hypothetical protein